VDEPLEVSLAIFPSNKALTCIIRLRTSSDL